MTETTGNQDDNALKGFPFADRVNAVTMADVWSWLAAGWRDMRNAGWISIAYGSLFVLAGFAITGGLVLIDMKYLITPMIAGFLLVGPLLAMGFYEISRALEAGEKPSFFKALMAWRKNAFHILTAGLILMLFLMIWARLAVLVFAMSFPYKSLTLGSFVDQLATIDGIVFVAIGAAVGGALAVIAFVTNVTALPMMLETKTDFFGAGICSVVAVLKNPKPMFGWAALIVLFTAAGLATFYVGLAITLPLIGHASWHAYRGLIKPKPE